MLPELKHEEPAPGDPSFAELQSIVVGATGNYRLLERHSLLHEKATRRLLINGLASLQDYLAFIKKEGAGEAELDHLIAELTVGETSFFRHPEQFEALRDHILPACLERNRRSRQLRIWSAGSSNGAEAYSIAITVHALLGKEIADWHVSIVGSDINRAFLAEAEAGKYSAWMFRNMVKESVPAFFEQADQSWSIREKYKANVSFVKHNLISEEVPSLHKNIFAFDVIFCRNVMIYFGAEANAALTERLAGALVDDGWLFVAPADFHSHLLRVFNSEKLGGASVLRRKPPAEPRTLRTAAPEVAADASAVARVREPAAGPARARPARARRSSPARRRAADSSAKPGAKQLPDIEQIIASANKGDWKTAARHCEEILATDACNVAAHYYHGLILQYTGATVAAEQAWRRVVYLDRVFALAHYQLGLARKEAHDIAGSRKAFRNAIEALHGVPDERPISPCDQITALDIRDLAAQQLQLLSRP